MKNVMKEAWKIARAAASRFGGKVREYIGEALRIAWAAAKNVKKSITDRIEELEGMGFKRWQKNGMDRMYINASALGLDCDYYKTGNISGAEFQGRHVSNSEARRMKDAKTYIDLVKKTLVSDNTILFAAAADLIGVEVYRYGDTRANLD